MAYQANIINNSQPTFEELDEFIMRLLNTVVVNSNTGNLSKAQVDLAFTEANIQNVTENTGRDVLLSVYRDNSDPNNFDFSKSAASYSSNFWGYCYNLYVRLDAKRNNQARLDNIVDEIIDCVCFNQSDGTPYQQELLISDGWSGAKYFTYLDKNKQIGTTIKVLEPFGSHINYYTAILKILFKIKKL